MEITTVINGKRYYTISQAYQTYGDNLEGKTSFNTFYKKFIKYKSGNLIQGKKHKALNYYSESVIEEFLQDYTLIVKYSTPLTSQWIIFNAKI